MGSTAHLIDDNQRGSPDVKLDVLGCKERNHINVICVNQKDMNGRSDEPSQNLQEIDKLLETNPDVKLDVLGHKERNHINVMRVNKKDVLLLNIFYFRIFHSVDTHKVY